MFVNLLFRVKNYFSEPQFRVGVSLSIAAEKTNEQHGCWLKVAAVLEGDSQEKFTGYRSRWQMTGYV